MRRITGILLAVCTALFMAVQTAFSAPAESGWEDRAQECFGYFMRQRGAEDFWDGLDSGATDWAAYCYARLYGADGAEEYAQSVERHVGELYSAGGFVRPTEYQRAAICITVTGGDPSLAARLGAFGCEILDRQGFNAYIWALIALNVTGIQPPEGAANTADTLTEYLIAHQHADGSFALMGDGGDVDITAAAVYALAGTDSPGAAEAAQRGADWLAGFDSYSTMGVRNCESTAQAVIALSAAGRRESAEKAAAQLEEYRREGGGYAHLPDGEVNQMATAQTLEAFTALALAERGGSLFGEYSGAAAEPDGAESTPESAEIPTLTAESTAESGIQPGNTAQGGLTGTHIRIIISAALGAAAVACGILFAFRRKKALIPAAALLAALAGGVWLLDIRTPEEYYSESGGGPVRVTVLAECSTVLSHMDIIDSAVNLPEVVPEDGVIIARCEVSLPEGATAFDALAAAARKQRVRVDYTGSAYGTYVRGIGYVTEFGFGELSGWMYTVNGEFPDVSVSDRVLGSGDVVEFRYTCDLGRDVGDDYYDRVASQDAPLA
ncbi:MAG: DUF4430 domain-containing protein [Ruminococcaceae bacterium]|nr:DUF4430 domain-containing protein [Oscillospiraceae bacterium]